MSQINKSDLIRQIREEISFFSSQVSIEDGDFNVLTQDDKGIQLTGNVSIFNIHNVGMKIMGTMQGAQVSASFSSGLTGQVTVGGKTIQSWIPDWLAGKIDLHALSLDYQKTPVSSASLNLVLGEISGAPLIQLHGFRASQPELIITLEKTGDEQSAKAVIKGNLAFGGATLDLDSEADSDGVWSFKALADDIKLNSLLQNIAGAANISLQPLPSEFEALDIKQALFSLNNERQVDIEGQWPWGELAGYFQKGSQFMLAFAPDNSFRFSHVASALSPIDNIKFKDVAFIYCNAAMSHGASLAVVNKMGLTGKPLPAGLSIMGTYDLPPDLPGLKGDIKVVLKATIPPSITTPSLQAAMAFKGLDLGPNFSLLESFIQLSPMDMSFGAGLRFRATLDKCDLFFSGMGEIAAPATFGVVMYLEDGSIWKNPFGLPAIEIGELGLDVGADVLSPAPRPKLGIRGKLKIGPFQGEGAGMLNTADPIESLISAKMDELSFQQCVDTFLVNDVKQLINQLPVEARTFGLKNAELTIVPKPQQMAGRQYDAGLRIKGDATIANLQAKLDINVIYKNGVSGMASVSPIVLKQGNTVIFRLSGNKETDPSLMSVDMTLSNLMGGDKPFLKIDGYVALLGIISNTNVQISKQGFYLFTSGKLFDKFTADLDVKGSNIQKPSDMSVRAAMKNDLISFLSTELEKAIDAATQAEQSNYRKAKSDLDNAQNYLLTTQEDVDAFNAQQAKVNDAKANVERLDRQADQKKRELDKAPWYRKFDLGIQYAAMKVSAYTATGVLNGYSKTLTELSKAVDWSKRNIAAQTINLASSVVTEFENASKGANKISKWIVEKGLGGIIDLKSAEFEGKLDVISGGKVSMQANVNFLGNPYHAGFDFDFSSPASAAKALADALLNNKAIAGAKTTLAGQIGKG